MDNYDIETLKNIINDLEEEKNTPLTKSKIKKQQPIEEIKEQPKEEIKEKPKEKKPMSEKKAEQFKLMQQKRKEQVDNIKKTKKLESAKVLLTEALKSNQSNKKQYLPKTDVISSSEEEEIIYLKKNKDKKKKVKKIIIQESESESESSVESIKEIKLKTNRSFNSARNKKSIVKVHDNNIKQPSNNFNPCNFFV